MKIRLATASLLLLSWVGPVAARGFAEAGGLELPPPDSWRTETYIRLALMQAHGESFDDFNGFSIYKTFKKGSWGWGLGFEDAEWNVEAPFPRGFPPVQLAARSSEAFAESRMYELALEWEPDHHGLHPFAQTSLGYAEVSVESHRVDGVRPYRETHGHEWRAGTGMGLRWHTGKKAILELALRAEYRHPDWRLEAESGGERVEVGDYWLTGVTLGLGLPY